MINYLGFAAGALTTASLVPQVVRILKTGSARDISLGMFLVLGAGVLLWALYGLLIGSPPVIIANVITLLLAAAVVVLKRKYG